MRSTSPISCRPRRSASARHWYSKGWPSQSSDEASARDFEVRNLCGDGKKRTSVPGRAFARSYQLDKRIMDKVKYRLNDPRLAPRRTRLEIPGWAGDRQPRANGSHEQVWHCVPFSEGAQYGIELFYPYDNELHVSTRDGRLALEGDWGPRPDGDIQWPPFRNFGDNFYTYQILLDLKVEKGFAIRTEPHPRFYTDPTDTVPI